MSERCASFSSNRLPFLASHETNSAPLRQSTETQTEREDTAGTRERELPVVVHKRSGNRYGRTSVLDNASVIQGDVTHHNYFYGGRVPYLAGLQGE